MKTLVSAALALLLASCALDDSPDGETDRYPARLVAGDAFDDAPLCDVETPCELGLDCLYIDALGEARCTDGATVCDHLACDDGGGCVIAESYPGQVFCDRSAD